jgi:6-pyruvoyl-tetrahydropterin synthase
MKCKFIVLGLMATIGKVGQDNPPRQPSRNDLPIGDKAQGDLSDRRSALSRPSSRTMRARLLFSSSPPELTAKHLVGKPGPRSEPPAARNTQAIKSGSDLEGFAYNKGDQAKSIKEFKQALAGDYIVTFNDNARQPEKFFKRITVYGENHLYPKLPSIPGDRGVVMFESKDVERCIKKYAKHESNRCISIDSPDLSAESMAFTKLKSAYYDVLNEIDPHALSDVEAQLGVRATTQEFMLKALAHIQSKTMELVASGNEEQANRIMEKMLIASEVSQQANSRISAGMKARDHHMFEQARANIQSLSADEAATIVVGDGHADKLFARLNRVFPERALVKCKVVNMGVA